jgi:hypothetical protein
MGAGFDPEEGYVIFVPSIERLTKLRHDRSVCSLGAWRGRVWDCADWHAGSKTMSLGQDSIHTTKWVSFRSGDQPYEGLRTQLANCFVTTVRCRLAFPMMSPGTVLLTTPIGKAQVRKNFLPPLRHRVNT